MCLLCVSHVNQAYGLCAQDVLRGAADEVLSVLKNKEIKDPERQAGVEELLGPLAADKLAQLVAIGKLITDWVGAGAAWANMHVYCLRLWVLCTT